MSSDSQIFDTSFRFLISSSNIADISQKFETSHHLLSSKDIADIKFISSTDNLVITSEFF